MIKQYAETTGSADSETVDMVNTSVTKQVTKESLAGSRIVRQMSTPTGGMVVVVGLDAASYEKLQQHSIKTSMDRSEEHTSELQSRPHLVCRLLLEKKKKKEKSIS